MLTRASLLMGLLSLAAWGQDRYVVHLGGNNANSVAAWTSAVTAIEEL